MMSSTTRYTRLNFRETAVAILAVLFLVSLQTCHCQWIKHAGNPVMPLSDDGWDNLTIHAASVIKDGEAYVMWYSATNGVSSGIGMAESPDRIQWTRYGHNPLIINGSNSYDARYIFAPCVIRDEEGYKIWYTGSDADYIWTINLATSQDGVLWEKHPQNPVLKPGPEWYDTERVGDPWVVYNDGQYEMWYTCQSRPEITYGIGYAASEDGIHWVKHPDPVLLAADSGPDSGTVRDACVIRVESGYEMWYRGIEGRNWTICHATSSNGVDWSRNPQNPVLQGESGSWDERVWFPRVLVEEDRYSMWFASAEFNEIGYAYLPVAELSVPVAATIIAWILGLLHYHDAGFTDSG